MRRESSWPPPPGFECTYQHHCPHMAGVSVHHATLRLHQMTEEIESLRRAQETWSQEYDQLLEKYQQLKKDHAELHARWVTSHRNQFKINRTTGEDRSPESSPASKPAVAPHKKRGAPKGHPGWSRKKPTNVDRRVQVPPPSRCPHCRHGGLQPMGERWEHVQEDIVIAVRPEATCFDHHQAYCPRCDRAVVEAAEGEILNAPIGPVAKSTATWLRFGLGLSYRKVQRVFAELFGMDFVPASAWGFDRRAAAKGQALYDDLREKIQASAVVHADETSWRVDGVNHHLWFAGNAHLAYFHIDRHRDTETARHILGANFRGVLVSDDYGVYLCLKTKARQSCLAHYIRHARELDAQLDELQRNGEPHDEAARRFIQQTQALFKDACACAHRLRKRRTSRSRRLAKKAKFLNHLRRLCRHTLEHHPTETFRQRLLREQHACFTFLSHPDVEPTNNHAERSLRPSVILRKITFGNRSAAGARTHGVLTSLIHTAHRQSVHPIRFLRTLILAPTATAQAALYNNSS